ncbi:N-acetylneuraminate synthase [Paenibacillus sp. PR3]|uniref:N-acetylneuraminate synthase n=1 Tax=Paenibacillus terricola TaxID=2763503 RepID=A0ABR8MXK1_9BACL|nr:N-acetylneuraminate synthase [Paenibacillus terricola]MBD3920698.1 N-acetylneuraminate synthase [Paenibacillus terricola]
MTQKVYVIAEAGVNHNGSLEIAKQLVHAAAQAGADVVKFQTFQADALVSKNAPKAEYQKRTTNNDDSQLRMLERLQLSESDHIELIEECERVGIRFLSTPFDMPSLALLTERFQMSELKISSGDLTNLPLLYHAARKGVKLIISSGMSSLGDIEEALGAIAYGYVGGDKPSATQFREAYFSEEGQVVLRENVSLLHCTTEYPTPAEDVHLNKMKTLMQAFQLNTGYSDHTIGTEVPVAAVALGATIIEKHFTLDQSMEGPDHQASMEPDELAGMIQQIRNVEKALGSSVKIPAASEQRNKKPARKSVVAALPIAQGECITEKHLTIKRPGNGLPPSQYWELIGTVAKRHYEPDELID